MQFIANSSWELQYRASGVVNSDGHLFGNFNSSRNGSSLIYDYKEAVPELHESSTSSHVSNKNSIVSTA